jgi:cytochrome P450
VSAGVGRLASTVDAEPWEFYERVTAAGGIAWDDDAGAWLVSSYDAIRQIGLDDGVAWHTTPSVEDDTPFLGLRHEDWIELMCYGSTRVLASQEGPEHHRMHRWWMRAFSGRALAQLGEALVRPIAETQIDRFAARGRAELYAELADRVAPRVIARAMGLPADDDDWLEHFLDLLDRRVALIQQLVVGGDEPAVDARAQAYAAAEELRRLVRPYVEQRREGGGDDFVSRR